MPKWYNKIYITCDISIEGDKMIKADLKYNPYTRRIKVEFNGNPPRVNCMIEKYNDRPLQDWITDIPQIFHDEMNGYGFQLDFSGTELDYGELCEVFENAGISEYDVKLNLKNRLECREDKIDNIKDVLKWLRTSSSRYFDYNKFCIDNRDILESDFVCISVHGETGTSDLKNVTVERIDDVKELSHTDLMHTPIIYHIYSEENKLIRNEIRYLRQIKGVSDDQMFFCIGSGVRAENVIRLLKDAGIEEPVIISGINDVKVRKYLLFYPFSDHIADVIKQLRNVAKNIKEKIETELKNNSSSGDRLQEQIRDIENRISTINNNDKPVRNASFERPLEFDMLINSFINKINWWECKKTRMTDQATARKAANDLNKAAEAYYQKFCEGINKAVSDIAAERLQNMKDSYLKAVPDAADIENIFFSSYPKIPFFKGMINDLLSLKYEKYTDQKNGIFSQLFRTNNANPQQQPVLEITYYYQDWRNYVINKMMPVLKQIIADSMEALKTYVNGLSGTYSQKLDDKLRKYNHSLDRLAGGLSQEERLMHQENEWLNELKSKLKQLEWG